MLQCEKPLLQVCVRRIVFTRAGRCQRVGPAVSIIDHNKPAVLLLTARAAVPPRPVDKPMYCVRFCVLSVTFGLIIFKNKNLTAQFHALNDRFLRKTYQKLTTVVAKCVY